MAAMNASSATATTISPTMDTEGAVRSQIPLTACFESSMSLIDVFIRVNRSRRTVTHALSAPGSMQSHAGVHRRAHESVGVTGNGLAVEPHQLRFAKTDRS